MAQHDDLSGVETVVFIDQMPAEHRRRSKYGEEIRRDIGRGNAFRFTIAGGDRGAKTRIRRHRFHRAILVLVVHVFRWRESELWKIEAALGQKSSPYRDEFIGFGKGQWVQEHTADHAEDGRVGANAQREGHNHRRGERGALEQHANGVSQILHDLPHGFTSAFRFEVVACPGAWSLGNPTREYPNGEPAGEAKRLIPVPMRRREA